MHIHSHLLLAHRLVKKAKETGYWTGFSRLAFYWGNIRPDFHSPFLRGSHTYEVSIDRIAAKWKMAEDGILFGGPINSYRIGFVMHFIADYFTYAHNVGSDELDGDLGSHFEYEKKLHHILAETDPAFSRAVSIGDLKKYLGEKREEYLRLPPSHELDCEFIYSVAWALTQRALIPAWQVFPNYSMAID